MKDERAVSWDKKRVERERGEEAREKLKRMVGMKNYLLRVCEIVNWRVRGNGNGSKGGSGRRRKGWVYLYPSIKLNQLTLLDSASDRQGAVEDSRAATKSPQRRLKFTEKSLITFWGFITCR